MVDLAKVHICHQRALKRLQLVSDLTSARPVPRHPLPPGLDGRAALSFHIYLRPCLASPSVILRAQGGPSHVSVAVWHMLCPNPSCVCCRYGASPRQITDAVEEVTRAGCILVGMGREMSLVIHPWGHLRLLACSVLVRGRECWTPGPQAASWQRGRKKRAFAYWPCHLMKGKLVWARPRATDVGGGPAKTVLRVGE